MDAIFFGLRTGCSWGVLDATSICAHRAAHCSCQAWTQAGVFLAWWQQGLETSEALEGMDWAWLAMDGAMTTAPLGGGEQGGQAPHRPREDRHHAEPAHRGRRGPIGLAGAGAHRNDCNVTRATIERILVERPAPTADHPHGMCLDTGDDDDEVRDLLERCGCTAPLRARGEEAQASTRRSCRGGSCVPVIGSTRAWDNGWEIGPIVELYGYVSHGQWLVFLIAGVTERPRVAGNARQW
jgi:putative transposase